MLRVIFLLCFGADAMSCDEPAATSSGRFPTTAWGLIRRIQEERQDEPVPELNRFITAYWKPVFCFLRAKGYRLHEAQDLTQEFFLRLLERDSLRRADPQRGRFRNYLLKILARFLSDQQPGRARRQTSFEGQVVSIESLLSDAERTYEPPAPETPESVFLIEWKQALVHDVLQRLRRFYEEEDHLAWYEIFTATYFVRPPAKRVGQEALAQRYNITRDQVRYALTMTKIRFEHYLREEVRDQAGSETEDSDDIHDLLAMLGL